MDIPQSEKDKFTYGLVFDVEAVIKKHGYERVSLQRLMSALFGVLYREGVSNE